MAVSAQVGVVGRLLMVARRADETLSAPLRERGLERAWFDVLAALRRAGPPHELNPEALMELLMLSSGGMTKRLDNMERAGLSERHPDPGDRRGRLVRLTPAGKRLIDRASGSTPPTRAGCSDRSTRTSSRRWTAACVSCWRPSTAPRAGGRRRRIRWVPDVR